MARRHFSRSKEIDTVSTPSHSTKGEILSRDADTSPRTVTPRLFKWYFFIIIKLYVFNEEAGARSGRRRVTPALCRVGGARAVCQPVLSSFHAVF
ncbi:hypothetical protein EVAR_64262_1 [Eumeta japonica]|uniref:Uncharacterized protein n=1 Tax=Eumeta variegata TaxID=151549 RepID=A0A4C1YWJ2_EUMVA|nr:hypothetical protein EVAR_64262_1 [Eumeta japonica]